MGFRSGIITSLCWGFVLGGCATLEASTMGGAAGAAAGLVTGLLVDDGDTVMDRALALAPRLPQARLRSIVAFAALTGGIFSKYIVNN